jgi:2-polyprenyl-3-methyl-5-hydroxy-6-metoxy-1,4-benzoquinol methylase
VVFEIAPDNRVVACESCRLQFAESYPEIADADATVYTDDYFKPAIEETARRKVIFTELLDELESVLGGMGRLLDVGTGDGALPETAVERGWRAEGTEISTAMIEHARDRSSVVVHPGVLEDIVLDDGAYDAVIMNHVLEHVRDPGTTLRKVARILVPGGFVRIEVPNIASYSSRTKNVQSRLGLKTNRWSHYATGHHFWFFTPDTLRRTLEAAGLAVFRIYTPARQWGRKSALDRLKNSICKKYGAGKHIVAYARS